MFRAAAYFNSVAYVVVHAFALAVIQYIGAWLLVLVFHLDFVFFKNSVALFRKLPVILLGNLCMVCANAVCVTASKRMSVVASWCFIVLVYNLGYLYDPNLSAIIFFIV